MKLSRFLASSLLLGTLNLGAAYYECDLCNFNAEDGYYDNRYDREGRYDRQGRQGYQDRIYRNERGGYSYRGKNDIADEYNPYSRRQFQYDTDSNSQRGYQRNYQSNDPVIQGRVDVDDRGADIDQTGHKDVRTATSDHNLLLLIQDRIQRNPAARNIRIHIANGNVTILGWVERDQDKKDIKNNVKNIEGVKNVDDQLQVKESSDSSYKSDKKDSENKAEKNNPDFRLAEKVRDALKGGFFSSGYDTVSFDVSNGVVILRGTVERISDKKDVEDRVKNISEVKRVDNQISVQPKQ